VEGCLSAGSLGVTVTHQLPAGSAISSRNFTVFNMNDRHCAAISGYYTLNGRLRLKCDGKCAETIFRLLAKRRSQFKSTGASVQSTTDSRGLRISGSNAGYTKFRGTETGTGYPLHSPVSPSLPLQRVTLCHHISTGLHVPNFMCLEHIFSTHSNTCLLAI